MKSRLNVNLLGLHVPSGGFLLSNEFVAATCQWAYDAAQLEFEEECAEAVDGDVRLGDEGIDM